MSTLRINNIEAKSVPASPTIDEKIKLTNSSGDVLVHVDGKTSGITTIGINTTDGNIKFDENSNIVVTGIVTATAFHGDGSNLTNITGTTINNNADNRLITGSNSANTLEGEADLIFGADGDANVLRIAGGSSNITSSNHVSTKLQFQAKDPSTNSTDNIGASIDMIDESGNGSYQALRFQTFKQQLSPGLRETVRFTHDGHVNISDGNLVIGTAAKGIDFSAQTSTSVTGSSTSSELLDHYEEGTFTPVLASGTSLTVYRADFIRIGRLCHIELGVVIGSNSSGTVLRFERLPFNFNPGGDNAAGFTVAVTNTNRDDTFYGNRGNNTISCANKSNQDVSTSTYSNKQIRISGSYIIS